MPIVSSEIHGSISKPGGFHRLLMQAIDHTGKVWTHRPVLPKTDDGTAKLAAWVANFDEWSQNYERSKLETFIAEGGDPENWTRVYLSAEQTARAAVKIMMQAEDPLSVMPTAEYIQANITNTQLQDWFGTTNGIKVRNRTDAMVANKAFLEADRDDAGEIE